MRRSYVYLLGSAGVLVLFLATVTAQSPAPLRPTAPAAPGQAQGQMQARALPAGNVERGRYISENVAMCVECHSGRDGAGNIMSSQRYLGSELPITPPSWGRNWATRAPRNRGLAGYDDAQAMRLLTEGSISRHGVPLRPPMPRFRMNAQDAADVIAFFRSL
jgi:hypothetical protein